ncbi:hypothetical protein [Burkholderia plantarii]|uniref:hypothetical protein n=1 Tax=Burkholderia plantarii TaxID=41899 RepID=UPI0018DEC17F|nr:hypothetical protein [Burkholderia plantarii]MBI0325480.1 hypothetical protein [Burkholderia plantarii]
MTRDAESQLAFAMNRIAILNHMPDSHADTALRIATKSNTSKDSHHIKQGLDRSAIRHFQHFDGGIFRNVLWPF